MANGSKTLRAMSAWSRAMELECLCILNKVAITGELDTQIEVASTGVKRGFWRQRGSHGEQDQQRRFGNMIFYFFPYV